MRGKGQGWTLDILAFEQAGQAPEQDAQAGQAGWGCQDVMQRIQAVAHGDHLSRDEVLALYGVPSQSLEAYQLQWAAHEVAQRLCRGTGQVFAQIGIDATPCPGDCLYCGYATVNATYAGRAEVPLDEVVGYARTFDKNGVHLISLMATSVYDFTQFLELVAQVRAAVRPGLPLLANMGDISLEQAHQLKAAGVNAFYHAVRVGEGIITSLDPVQRFQTITHVQQAGLKLMSGVEPLYEEQDPVAVVDRMFEVAALEPLCGGVSGLVAVSGSRMEQYHPPTLARKRTIAALLRLVMGSRTLFGSGGNVVWVDAGTDPRGRTLPVDHAVLAHKVAQAKKQLEQEEWVVAKEPLGVWL
jgi:biotin synthase